MEWNSSAIIFESIEKWYKEAKDGFYSSIIEAKRPEGEYMKQQDVDVVTSLWNEAIVEALGRCLPEHIVFAEKIISREVEIAARAVCFMCSNNKPEKKNSVWKHVFKGSDNYHTTEPCRAGNIRDRLEE
jgi:hypothetical protein